MHEVHFSIPLVVDDPALVRQIADDPRFQREELYQAPASGHLFAPGDKVVLTGLQDFAELNGKEVEITSIRENGEFGRAYYIEGDAAVRRLLNWTYEYRLEKRPA